MLASARQFLMHGAFSQVLKRRVMRAGKDREAGMCVFERSGEIDSSLHRCLRKGRERKAPHLRGATKRHFFSGKSGISSFRSSCRVAGTVASSFAV